MRRGRNSEPFINNADIRYITIAIVVRRVHLSTNISVNAAATKQQEKHEHRKSGRLKKGKKKHENSASGYVLSQ